VVDLDACAARLRSASTRWAAPASHYWGEIAERYRLPTHGRERRGRSHLRFMTLDWDGKIRMDCSSPYAMRALIALKDRLTSRGRATPTTTATASIARSAGCSTRITTSRRDLGTLLRTGRQWPRRARRSARRIVSSSHDRPRGRPARPDAGRGPVGFKWFVDGLLDGSLGFGGEESAGARSCAATAPVWTTDKDGHQSSVAGAEMTAVTGHDPGDLYRDSRGVRRVRL
jgi:phosphoglucomutase